VARLAPRTRGPLGAQVSGVVLIGLARAIEAFMRLIFFLAVLSPFLTAAGLKNRPSWLRFGIRASPAPC
jgi:hypothetical protein